MFIGTRPGSGISCSDFWIYYKFRNVYRYMPGLCSHSHRLNLINSFHCTCTCMSTSPTRWLIGPSLRSNAHDCLIPMTTANHNSSSISPQTKYSLGGSIMSFCICFWIFSAIICNIFISISFQALCHYIADEVK